MFFDFSSLVNAKIDSQFFPKTTFHENTQSALDVFLILHTISFFCTPLILSGVRVIFQKKCLKALRMKCLRSHRLQVGKLKCKCMFFA